MFGQIQPLAAGDLPGCLALARGRNWPPDERKWRLLFDLGTMYGVRDQAGELAGVVVLTRYGTRLAVIGMLLVAERHGGRGVGRALMTRALAEAGDAAVYGQANGTDRAHLVRRLPGFTDQLRVVERLGAVTGYAGAYRSTGHVSIGPVIAESADDAKTLIADVAAEVAGPVRIDLDDRHPELLEWGAEHGLAPGVSSAAMVLGGGPLPGDRARCFAPLMRALG
jgi:GNAT superfamily N-acetyltransferase